MPALPYLFNFSASPVGGGFKRLAEFARVFDARGGAWFIANPASAAVASRYPNNRFFFPDRPRALRLIDDWGYVRPIVREMGTPELYYAYGIPMYQRVGRVNWFHLSNVLPLVRTGIPLDVGTRAKLAFLGWRIRRHLPNADVVAAESEFSLGLIDGVAAERKFLSVNGGDDEIAQPSVAGASVPDAVATVVGTARHKGLDDSVRVFDALRRETPGLRLELIGATEGIAQEIRRHTGVVIRGALPRAEVISALRRSRYYVSTTHIENSWNAASEGMFFAEESYISDIGPHRELLRSLPFNRVSIPGMPRQMLHVRREHVTTANLRSWESLVDEIETRTRQELTAKR